MFFVEVGDFLNGILNRFEIGIEHGGRVDLFFFQKIDFCLHLRDRSDPWQDDQPEQTDARQQDQELSPLLPGARSDSRLLF